MQKPISFSTGEASKEVTRQWHRHRASRSGHCTTAIGLHDHTPNGEKNALGRCRHTTSQNAGKTFAQSLLSLFAHLQPSKPISRTRMPTRVRSTTNSLLRHRPTTVSPYVGFPITDAAHGLDHLHAATAALFCARSPHPPWEDTRVKATLSRVLAGEGNHR